MMGQHQSKPSRERTLLELGHSVYIRRYSWSEAVKNRLIHLDLSDLGTVKAAYDKFGVEIKTLEEYGRESQGFGVAKKWTERPWTIMLDPPVPHIYRRLSESALEIDGTMKWYNDVGRYKRFFGYRAYTCCIDAVLSIAILLNAGRLQVDQTRIKNLCKLSELALTVLSFVRSNIASAQPSSMDVWRDLILELLYEHNPSIYKRPKKGRATDYLSFALVIGDCLNGLPQISYTSCSPRKVCDDENWRANTPITTMHCVYLKVSNIRQRHASFEGTVNAYFNQANFGTNSTVACTAGDKCRSGGQHPSIEQKMKVLDRLPPRLLIILDSDGEDFIRYEDFEKFGMLEPFEVICETLGGKEQAAYRTLGIVIFAGGYHYFVRWNLAEPNKPSSLIEVNTLKSPHPKRIDSWWADLETSTEHRKIIIGTDSYGNPKEEKVRSPALVGIICQNVKFR